MFCGAATILHVHESDVAGRKLRCRSWSCDDCRPLRLDQLRQLALAGRPSTFITLTANIRAFETPDEAAVTLVKAWRSFVQRYNRAHPTNRMAYLCVIEQTKRGWPHIHILARCGYIPQKELSNFMGEHARSPIVDIRRVHRLDHAAAYVSKYVSKGPERFEGTKRYWCTQSWTTEKGETVREGDALYRYSELLDMPLHCAARYVQTLGFRIEWPTETGFVAYPEPGAYWPGQHRRPRDTVPDNPEVPKCLPF